VEFLEIGKIVKAQGLKGRVKVLSYLQPDEKVQPLSLREVYVSQSDSGQTKFMVRYFQVKGNCFFLEVEGIDSIEQAEPLRGHKVFVPADHMGSLPEDEYYWQQLLGLAVFTEEGEPLGKIERIFPTGSNDVFVCGQGAREILLPSIADVVRHVDLEKGIMTVRLLEGL